ncbi:MAG: cyclic nucleotide-binding domain-containing protein [Chloroflexota bacterium]|nr:MAG: cyclic nucleotide-binding domain-containing protein [Chloroflexota bacterium]
MAAIDSIKRERNTKHFRAGEKIFAEGDAANSMFSVVEGKVDILKNNAVLETIPPDGIFGEMGLVNNKPRMAAAVAKTDCTVVEVNQADFYFLIQHSPYFAIQVMQILSDRVRRHTDC